MMKYAIVQPDRVMPGSGIIVALSATQPVAQKPLVVVELKGYYTSELGDECPYMSYLGGYVEALVDTTGT